MLHLPEVVHRRFQLSTNPAENQLLRSGFYYEQVWTLCAGLVWLHVTSLIVSASPAGSQCAPLRGHPVPAQRPDRLWAPAHRPLPLSVP